jgi:hypothetical protein
MPPDAVTRTTPKPWSRAKLDLHVTQRIRERADIAIIGEVVEGEVFYALRAHGETMLWQTVLQAIADAGWQVCPG